MDSLISNIANVALVFVGLTAVVGVFRKTAKFEWLPQEMEGVKLMISHSIAALALSLAAQAGLSLGVSSAIVWTSCSLLLAIFLLANLVAVRLAIIRLGKKGHRPRYRLQMYLIFFPGSVGVSALALINAINWKGPTVFIIGLFWLLFTAVRQFLHFLFPKEPA